MKTLKKPILLLLLLVSLSLAGVAAAQGTGGFDLSTQARGREGKAQSLPVLASRNAAGRQSAGPAGGTTVAAMQVSFMVLPDQEGEPRPHRVYLPLVGR